MPEAVVPPAESEPGNPSVTDPAETFPPEQPPELAPAPPILPPDPTPAPPPEPSYPEPVAARYTPAPNALAFYDKDKTGQLRAVRNDLGGSLPGMVQFAQSHTVDPSGNKAKDMPTLTSEREALLLVTPDASLGEIDSLRVAVSVGGVSMGTLPMRHPNAIFRSDYSGATGRPDYVYSRRAWSVVLPWKWVQPGLALRVSDDQSRVGTLAASAIEFAAPAELVVHSIRLGMLTTPEVNDGQHWFRSHPAEAATDYFQTIPAARVTAAYYEDTQLPAVMVSSGVIHKTSSTTSGGWYDGDMRADTAKSTFSVGINLANYGVTSSAMESQLNPQLYQSVVIHHARGIYTNGQQEHGYSGGNGILTLDNSVGNEFSHEIGHHYGIGHYYGEVDGNRFWASHHHDSGWGYIGYRKRMRANLLWTTLGTTPWLSGAAVLDNTYLFSPDAMAGGNNNSGLSKYTHYTGYSTARLIQPSLDKPVPSAASPTGYKKWNTTTRTMDNVEPATPTQSQVWYNSANKKFLAPRLHGVPVVTLLGGYDPDTGNALIYPAQRSNWGNVFTLPEQPVASTEPRTCWIAAEFADGNPQRIALSGKRLQNGKVNKLHVNLAQADKPTRATLWCQTPTLPAQSMYVLDIPQNLPAMPPAVVVGKEAGYDALAKVELPVLDAALQALAGKKVLVLDNNAQLLYESHAERALALSAVGQAQLQRYAQQQEQAARLNRWMSVYARDLAQGVPEAQAALMAFIDTLGLGGGAIVPAAQTLTMANGSCVQKVGAAVRVAGKSLCTGGTDEQWILEPRGSIRNRADLSQCLTDQGGTNAVKLVACDVRNDNQAWDTSVTKRFARGGRCMDLSGGYLTANVGTLITYKCSGNVNQQWAGLLPSESLALSLATAANVPLLEKAATATGR